MYFVWNHLTQGYNQCSGICSPLPSSPSVESRSKECRCFLDCKSHSHFLRLVCLHVIFSTVSNHPPASAITGFWVDKSGTEWPTFICLLFSLPWWVGIIFEYRLSFFLACFALECEFFVLELEIHKILHENVAFFLSGVVSPITVDLTSMTRGVDGVRCKRIQISNITPSTDL
jgi:hypothetical protein